MENAESAGTETDAAAADQDAESQDAMGQDTADPETADLDENQQALDNEIDKDAEKEAGEKTEAADPEDDNKEAAENTNNKKETDNKEADKKETGQDRKDDQDTSGTADSAKSNTGAAPADKTDTKPESTGYAAETTAADAYVPALDALDFNAILDKNTGIYYHAVEEGGVIEDSSVLYDWEKVKKDTELAPNDLLRIYLSYTIPAGSLNATNDIARYRLPGNIHLSDAQKAAINGFENGISGQYMNYDALEITDPGRHTAYIGAEAVEGRRRPDQTVEDYLAGLDKNEDGTAPQELISAVVRTEDVCDSEGNCIGTDLVFTFSTYTVARNQHEYDKDGNQTKAGERVRGWFCFDLNTSQIDWATVDVEESLYAVETENNDIENNNAEENSIVGNGAEENGTAGNDADGTAGRDASGKDAAENVAEQADRNLNNEAASGQTGTDRSPDDTPASDQTGTETARNDAPVNDQAGADQDSKAEAREAEAAGVNGNPQTDEASSGDAENKENTENAETAKTAEALVEEQAENAENAQAAAPSAQPNASADPEIVHTTWQIVTTKEAEIIFTDAVTDQETGEEKQPISTKLVLKITEFETREETREPSADDPALVAENAESEQQAETDDAGKPEDGTDADTAGADDTGEDTAKKEAGGETESADADKENEDKDKTTETDKQDEEDSVNSPAATFEDTITVHMGTLSTDTDSAAGLDIPDKTELTVHVDADEGTFPEGTTMVLTAVTGNDLDDVAQAVEGAVEGKTKGFYAVDITFKDANGKVIEPRKPVKVSMKGETIRKATENASTEPVVVHLEDTANPAGMASDAGQAENGQAENGPEESEKAEGVASDGAEKEKDSAGAAEAENAAENEPALEKTETDENSDVATVTGEENTSGQDTKVENLAEAEQPMETVEKFEEESANTAESAAEKSAAAPTATVVETYRENAAGKETADKTANDTIMFEGDSFSIYAIVYTVDFHYEVNGKTYEFSIPGGGFLSFYKLVEVLGIEVNDANTEKDEILELVDGVESIVFSNPDLVSVSKVEEDTTVGAIKDRLGLECEYSTELTEEQIEKINAQEAKARDWALISLKAFDTEESLTVTMKNGDQWTVKVTDAQIKKTVIDAKGDKWEITVTYDEFAQIPDGAELRAREILPEDNDYQNYYKQSLKTVGVGIQQESNKAESEAKSASDPKAEDKVTELPVNKYARIFDIEIWAGDDKVEPKSNVTVDIRLLDAPEKTELLPHVVHFAEDGTELMELTEKPKSNEKNIQFKTDEFSVYSVIYTVDLHYDAETGTLSYEDNKLKVTVSAKEKKKEKGKEIFPEEAVLIVKEMIPDDADAADKYAQALTALSNALRKQKDSFSAAKVYDFSILDKTGKEIEPNGEVEVKIEYKERPEFGGSDGSASEIQIAHLVEDPLNEEKLSVEFMDADIDSTALGRVSGAEFTTDSFSAYIVFNRNGITETEPTDLGNYGWIRFHTVGERDTTQNQTGNPDSPTIQWGYYKNDGSNLPALNTAWAYRRILKVRLWLPRSGQDSSVYDSDHYNEAATAQYFWVWQNEINVEEFELPGYEVVHTRMHTAWDEENGRQSVENDSLVGSYAVRGYRRSTLSNEPGAKNSDLNVLDIYAKPLPQTTGMNYIIRYVHADGSVTDGNVRSLSSGSVTYNASQYQRNGEVYAGTSVVTGSEAINANTANGTGTITYKSDVSLAKVYVYYKIDPEGNGNPTARGRYDKDENRYYTGQKGLYTDKSAEAVSGKDRQFILNLESWYVDNAASVGMVLDASGSMAWTSGAPEPIVLTNEQVAEVRRTNGMWQDQYGNWHGDNDIYFDGGSNDSAGNPPNTGQYITNFSALSKILDKTKTDNSAMGYNGYHYYLKDMRSTVREYVALGYSDGNQSAKESLGGRDIYTTRIGNTSYTGTVLANRFIKDQNNAHGQNEGWYYVNSTGNTKAYYKYTGKSYDGYSSKGWWPNANDPNRFNLQGGPLRFYIKTGTNELWVSYYDGSAGEIRQSPVYEKREKMFTKMETLQDAVSQFGAIVLGSSPDSQIGLTRFSQNIKTSNNTGDSDYSLYYDNSSYLPLLNWSSSTEELSAAMNLSTNAKGSTGRNDDGLYVYEYGLTGQTRTWTGVKAYSDYLKNSATAANHKYLIIFTDGKDTNGDATHATWGATGTQIQQLKNEGYTIITVMMRSQAMVGSEYTDAKRFLQGIASPGLDGNTTNTAADNKLHFEADSNSTKDVIDAFRQIANRIASGLNGYTIRDYIDPRFDVMNDAGDILTVLDSNGQFTNATNPDVDAVTGLRAFTTPDNKQAYLGYDPVKKMFYVLWQDQEIPASTLGSTSVNPWKSQIRIQAKADFLGGNDILSNGNETGMNQVYYPDVNGSPVISDHYPRKDFPRTAVNPATLDIRLSNYEDTIFLGENISPASLYANVQTKRNQETDSRELYFDYLVRAGKKLHNDPMFYLNILKYAVVPPNYEQISVKDKDGITPLETVTVDGNVKGITLTLPYYYLESPGDVTSYAGGTLHQGDKTGTITYKWTALDTGGHALPDGNALKDYTSSTTDTVRYQLSVSYTPDAFVSNHIDANGNISGDSIPNNGSARTQTLIGETGTGSLIRDPNGIGAWATAKNTNEGANANTQGLAVIHVVDGKIKVSKKIEISQSDWNRLVTSAGSSGLTFTFQLKKDGENYGNVIMINSNTAVISFSGGFVTLETNDWFTGLPQGNYTLVETGQPAGFTFHSVTAAEVAAEDGGTQYAAPTEGSISWKIGQYVSGTPSTCAYADTDFSAAKVKDNNKEVDPGLSAGSGKNYLNAQIGKGVVINEPPKTIDVTLKKVDKADLNINSADLLKGATFTITKYTDNTFRVKDTSASAWTSTLEDIKDGDTYTLNGNFEFKGLPVGFYKLDESVMPAGYITVASDPVFEVRLNSVTSQLEVVLYQKNGNAYSEVASGLTDMARIDAVNTIYIANEPGAALPNTGGPGTTLIYLVGIMLTGIAGGGLVMKRWKRDADCSKADLLQLEGWNRR